MSHMINGFVFPSDLRLTLPSPTSSAIATPPPGSDNHYATDPVSESALLPSASSASVVVSPGTPVSSQNASRKGKRGFNDVEDPKEVSDDGASSSSKRKRVSSILFYVIDIGSHIYDSTATQPRAVQLPLLPAEKTCQGAQGTGTTSTQ